MILQTLSQLDDETNGTQRRDRCAGCNGGCCSGDARPPASDPTDTATAHDASCGNGPSVGGRAASTATDQSLPPLAPAQRVLATLEADGSRRWMYPKLSKGFWWKQRRVVAYALIAVFVILPWVRIGGQPALLADIPGRKLHLLGMTFLPTDTLLLALLMLGVGIGIFFLTAVFGRVWCGWACPQTVYLEYVFRPIDRLLGGVAGRGGKPKRTGTRALAYPIYFVFCFFIANTFLAYFVGTDRLTQWVVGSPFDHFFGFSVVLFVTGAMMFNFLFFREQLCQIACPYGRFQSVMLDRNSLIVSYDTKRGAPRGKGKEKGECVDCTMCVQVCPMGIDIRDGLQMECTHCTQCIDACNDVMGKLKREPNLIGYATGAKREGEAAGWFKLRPRVILYPAALLIISGLFLLNFGSRQSINLTVLRSLGAPYSVLDDGSIVNTLRVKVVNRTDEPRSYTIAVDDPRLTIQQVEPLTLEAGETRTHGINVVADPSVFTGGQFRAEVTVTDDQGASASRRIRILAPQNTGVSP
ncbi:MAG: cytochrome c oxidase accessory protein CcoG [Planctomycetota bacterium]